MIFLVPLLVAQQLVLYSCWGKDRTTTSLRSLEQPLSWARSSFSLPNWWWTVVYSPRFDGEIA